MKILVVGMADSVHLSRWLSQFEGSDHEFVLVSSSPHRKLHPQLKELLKTPHFSMPLISRVLSLPLWIVDRLLDDRLRGLLIASVFRRFSPDAIHVLEFQNGGYSYLRALYFDPNVASAKLLLTPYGSDIFWFQNFPKHLSKIKRLLQIASAMSCECQRDEALARKFGFQGVFGPRIPAFGAIDIVEPDDDRTSRNLIAVKGYQNHWGQALNALAALKKICSDLRAYEIVFYSCNRATIKAAKAFAWSTGVRVKAYKKNALTSLEMSRIFQKSAIYIGLSKSDGISASMIEAMANGAIPIQSDTSCSNEWMVDGLGGYLVKYDDVDGLSQKILETLTDISFQEKAAAANFISLREKLNPSVTRQAAYRTYEILTSE